MTVHNRTHRRRHRGPPPLQKGATTPGATAKTSTPTTTATTTTTTTTTATATTATTPAVQSGGHKGTPQGLLESGGNLDVAWQTPIDTTALSQAVAQHVSGDAQVDAVAAEASAALARLAKRQGLALELHTRLPSPRFKAPKAMAGIVVDKGKGDVFYPADPRYLPVPLTAEQAAALPRGQLVVLDGSSGDAGAVHYDTAAPAEAPQGSFVGVVDEVGGQWFVRDLSAGHPRLLPIDVAAFPGLTQGAVVAVKPTDADDGVALETLAKGGSGRSRAWAAAAKLGFSPTFSAAAAAQAQALSKQSAVDDAGLVDLTHVPFFAVDEASTKDWDQAYHVTRTPNGGFRVQVALADLTALVKPGTPLFREMLERGGSLYLGGLCIPMQPDDVTHAAGMAAHEKRRAVVIDIEIDADGKPLKTRFQRALIQSQAQLAYADASAHIDGTRPLTKEQFGKPLAKAVADELALLPELVQAVQRAAQKRGALAEEKDTNGGDVASKATAAFSFLANAAAAELLSKKPAATCAALGVYRARKPMPPSRLDALRRQINTIVDMRKDELSSPGQWRWRQDEEFAAYYARLKSLPSKAERPIAQVIRTQLDQARMPLEWTREVRPHDELRVPAYSRVSAALREGVSFVNQAVLGARLTLDRARAAASPPLDDKQVALLWDHLVLACLVDPARLPPERAALVPALQSLERLGDAALGKAAAALVVELAALPPLDDKTRGLANGVLDASIRSTVNAKDAGGRIMAAAMRALWDQMFASDLGGVAEGDPDRPAPVRVGRVERVSPQRIDVRLTEPDVVVRIDLPDDVQRSPDDTFVLAAEGAAVVATDAATGQERVIQLGAQLKIRAVRHDGAKLRFTIVD